MRKSIAVFAILAFLLVSFSLSFTVHAAGWQDFWDDARFRTDVWINDDLTVDDDATIAGTLTASGNLASPDLVISDDLDVTDDARITGTVTAGDVVATVAITTADLSVTDDLTVTSLIQGKVQVAAFTANANGAAQTLTPTSNAIVIAPTGAVTLSIALVANGTVLYITNDGSTNVLFPDGGDHLLKTARTVVTNDTLTLVQIGSKWHELAFIDN